MKEGFDRIIKTKEIAPLSYSVSLFLRKTQRNAKVKYTKAIEFFVYIKLNYLIPTCLAKKNSDILHVAIMSKTQNAKKKKKMKTLL